MAGFKVRAILGKIAPRCQAAVCGAKALVRVSRTTVEARAGEISISINLRAVVQPPERSRFTLIFTDIYWWLP
jgi:hypothetical protein